MRGGFRGRGGNSIHYKISKYKSNVSIQHAGMLRGGFDGRGRYMHNI